LQCVAVCCSVLQRASIDVSDVSVSFQILVVHCCNVLQCVAVCSSVFQCDAMQYQLMFVTFVSLSFSLILQCVAICCSVSQCTAVYYSVLQCIVVSHLMYVTSLFLSLSYVV